MPDTVIKVENLGKKYRLRHQGHHDSGLRHVLQNALTAPFKALGKKAFARRTPKIETVETKPSIEEFWALKDVSIEIERGEVIGIIGRNGAGKSTLLKILSRITDPTTGRIEIEGRVASLLEVGTGFHAELTGRENIYLNGTILGMTRKEIKRKFDEIIAFAEVEKFLDTPIKHYSSGMYVRLAFAVAAHLEPDILIVDEVLAVGDAQFQQKCLGKMESVAEQEGRTVIFVSHNIAAVRQLCKRVFYMEKGKLVFQGPTAEGLSRYLDAAGLGNEEPHPMIEPPPNKRLPLWLKRARVYSEDCVDGHLLLNQPLTVSIEFVSKEPTREVLVGLDFYDAGGAPLLCINNAYLPHTPLPTPATSGQVICELGIVPFMAGRYSISLWIGLNEHTLQHIEHALTFTIMLRDAWGTGTPPPEKVAPLWWPTRFILAPTPRG